MIFKMLPKQNQEAEQIFARIDGDGLCRETCIAEHPPFQEYLKNGGQLQDADGNVMSADAAKTFVESLS
jgi:hypothetical protein